jgi:hypothetical protein
LRGSKHPVRLTFGRRDGRRSNRGHALATRAAIREIDYQFLLRHLDRIGYGGWVGCEYRPLTTTEAGLGWMKQFTGVP